MTPTNSQANRTRRRRSCDDCSTGRTGGICTCRPSVHAERGRAAAQRLYRTGGQR